MKFNEGISGAILQPVADFGAWSVVSWIQETVVFSGKPFGFIDDEGNVLLGTCIPLSLLLLVARLLFDVVFTVIASKVGVQLAEARKFRESNFKGIFYIVSWIMCVYVMSIEEYWPETRNCWVGMDKGPQPRPPVLQAYYVWELSFYISSTLATVILDERLKDFYILMTHHIATIFLISISYVGGSHRIGVLVLYCHDFNDIFLEYAKVFHYMHIDAISNALFGILFVSWPYFRLYILPFIVIYSATFESAEIAGVEHVFQYHLLNGLLYVLVVFHIYWYFLITKVLVKTLTSGIEDVRESKPTGEDWVLRMLGAMSPQFTSSSSPKKSKAKKAE